MVALMHSESGCRHNRYMRREALRTPKNRPRMSFEISKSKTGSPTTKEGGGGIKPSEGTVGAEYYRAVHRHLVACYRQPNPLYLKFAHRETEALIASRVRQSRCVRWPGADCDLRQRRTVLPWLSQKLTDEAKKVRDNLHESVEQCRSTS